MSIYVLCPDCRTRLKVPDSSFGRRGKCNKCGHVFEISPATQAERAATPSLAVKAMPLSSNASTRPPAISKQPQAITLDLAPSANAIARAPDAPEKRTDSQSSERDVISQPVRGFWPDAALSFLTPFQGRGRFVLVILLILYTVNAILGFASIFGLAGRACITGWIVAYYFSVVAEVCRGADDLPPFIVESGLWDGIVRPMLLWAGSMIVAFLPLAIWLAVWGTVNETTSGLSEMAGLAPAIGFAALGIFLCPMVVLTVAINGFTWEALRYDRHIAAIGRTPLAYLGIWLFLLLVVGGRVIIVLTSRLLPGIWARGMSDFAFHLVAETGLMLANGYLALVGMRIIGLFYRHHKHHFLWLAE